MVTEKTGGSSTFPEKYFGESRMCINAKSECNEKFWVLRVCYHVLFSNMAC